MATIASIFSGAVLRQRVDVYVAAGVVIVIMMLIVPLPTFLLDFLMALNLTISLLTILMVLYVKDALEFSIFPTLLLVSTVYGLALNVSSTRLILAQGAQFNGRIIRAFSRFVVGTSGAEGLVIGIIIFIIIVAVQFIVITKGATRVAEVAARFTLDALPGKQMTIESEFNTGALNEREAHKRKIDLQREVDFYGAMDGASKFVSGNVKVGILITVINIIGGIITGVTIRGETFGSAIENYISFAIGDGLVTQFPALMISTATGLIVTRAISDTTFGNDLTGQFSGQGRIYWIAAIFLIVLGFLPGFPWYVLFPMAGLFLFLAIRLGAKKEQEEQEKQKGGREKAQEEASSDIAPIVPLETLSLELGYALVPLVDKEKGADLLDRITRIRREVALESGLVVPRVRVVDNMRLAPSEYCLKIRGVAVGKGAVKMSRYLCINPGGINVKIEGEQTTDPTFGLPAIWIAEDQRDKAERAGYTVADSPTVIATHLTELIKHNAADILGRQETRAILNALSKDYQAVVDDAQKEAGLSVIQKVLQNLLRERVSIRNILTILEVIGDYGSMTKDPYVIVEKTRQALKRQISAQYIDNNRRLPVMTLLPALDRSIAETRTDTPEGPIAALLPEMHRELKNSLINGMQIMQDRGFNPILLCSEATRPLIKAITRRDLPGLIALSVREIAENIAVEGVVELAIPQANVGANANS